MTRCAALALAGCIPPGVYPVENLEAGDLYTDDLHASADVQMQHPSSGGWDLVAKVNLRYDGQGHPRIDLVRAQVRVDEGPWEACNHPRDAKQDDLVRVLEPGEEVELELVCEEMRRPYTKLELRFFASGAGGRGMVEMAYGGVDVSGR